MNCIAMNAQSPTSSTQFDKIDPKLLTIVAKPSEPDFRMEDDALPMELMSEESRSETPSYTSCRDLPMVDMIEEPPFAAASIVFPKILPNPVTKLPLPASFMLDTSCSVSILSDKICNSEVLCIGFWS